jgi:tetratricopeptide (TPR) repeat protein
VTLQIAPSFLPRFLIATLFAAATLAASEQSADTHPSEPARAKQPATTSDTTESELLKATEETPNNAEAWLAYAGFQTQHSQWQKAIEPLQRAIALSNHDGNTFLGLGMAYQYTQDQSRALEYYAKALEHGCDEALLHRGRLHAIMGKTDLGMPQE